MCIRTRMAKNCYCGSLKGSFLDKVLKLLWTVWPSCTEQIVCPHYETVQNCSWHLVLWLPLPHSGLPTGTQAQEPWVQHSPLLAGLSRLQQPDIPAWRTSSFLLRYDRASSTSQKPVPLVLHRQLPQKLNPSLPGRVSREVYQRTSTNAADGSHIPDPVGFGFRLGCVMGV